MAAHREDVALDVALKNGIGCLIDYERCLSMVPRVLVGLHNEPRRGIGYTLDTQVSTTGAMARSGRTYQIQNLARDDEIMQPVHHLLHGGVQVPVVEVQDVDVGRAELLERRFDGEVQRLGVVAYELAFLRDIFRGLLEVACELYLCEFCSVLRTRLLLTLVARTIWSRMLRCSIHSPRNISEVSSWLKHRQFRSHGRNSCEQMHTSCWRCR